MSEKKPKTPKRLRRTATIGELVERSMAPMVQKRGFANSELLMRWATIVGAPFDRGVVPDKLNWPREMANNPHVGAVLTVRVDPVYALAFTHETETIKASINRYFGFYLIDKIKPSRRPFVPNLQDEAKPRLRKLSEGEELDIASQVEGIEDEGLRDALTKLGRGLKGRD
ncbi:DUF721 domain-containing protein [Maritalea sp.]|uniref:DUF721 domain-containing protein n=1 Tax=Maritalea sp. TaxID=2003361 RepID=UPI003EF10E02